MRDACLSAKEVTEKIISDKGMQFKISEYAQSIQAFAQIQIRNLDTQTPMVEREEMGVGTDPIPKKIKPIKLQMIKSVYG